MNKKLLEYFKDDELAANVFESKYMQPGDDTPDDMHKRMAKEFARIEYNYILKERQELSSEQIQALSSYGEDSLLLKDEELPEEKLLEYLEKRIYSLFKDFKYIVPQGSIMSNLGNKQITSLSNCFVIGTPEDSYGGIFQKDEEMVQLMKRRGGVGIDISTLRPAGTDVTNAAKTSTGAISFMHRFSNSTREVAQGGRRGALMLSIDINHPDVMEFIKIKRDLTQVTGANISIKLNNEFMKAVKNDEDYFLRFPCNLNPNIEYPDPKDLEYNVLLKLHSNLKEKEGFIKKIKAKEYWNEIIKSAHGFAEPGIMFEDNHINYSPDGVYPQYKGVTTNPCGEIFMQPYDACRLIAVNLFSFVDNPFTDKAKFNFEKFYQINYESMRLSDDLIDLEIESINRILDKIRNDSETWEVKHKEFELWNKIKKTAQSSRRTGLGFTALGDALAALNLKYDSSDALDIIDKIMNTKMESELDCTIDLSILRGHFEGWDINKEYPLLRENPNIIGGNTFYHNLIKMFPDQEKRMARWGRRNVSWSTVAPTGSVSILTQTTSGLEPLFMPYYMRRKKVNPGEEGVRVDFTDQNGDTWQEFPVLHPKFKDWMLLTEPVIDGEVVNSEEWSKAYLEACFKLSPWYESTANDINWVKRVEIQSIIQKYISHSISSTINLPEYVTEDEVSTIYLESWKQGLKGITVYRDGSRSGVLVDTSKPIKSNFEYRDAPKRPKSLPAKVHHITVSKNPFTVIVGLLDDKPYEIFVTEKHLEIDNSTEVIKIKKGLYETKEGCALTTYEDPEVELMTRLVSTSLRHGADIKFIVEQLNKTSSNITSFSKAVSRVLKKYIPDGAKSTITCSNCGSDNVVFEEGCQVCKDCGNSKCG